ncbi:MAG: hypothetical protein WB116_03750 [Candidatus Dormiibacterota bacterium]
MSGVRLIRRANASGPVQLRRSLRDRCLMWGRFALAGLAGGTAFALGTPSLRDTVAVAIASAGVASLGMERLHHVFKSRTVGASAIRSHVSQNPAMSYFVPLPGVVAIIYASSQGVSGATMALVCTATAIFTWLAWEAAVRVVSRSQVAYRLATRWEVRASKAQRNALQAAESHWRDRQW